MTDHEMTNGVGREELVQRIALMETMIAEGRQSTARFGWIFVLWGLLYFAAVGGTSYPPFAPWSWPVFTALGIAITAIARARRKAADGGGQHVRSRGIEAAWRVMGCAIILYVTAAIASHHAGDQAYVAAILFFIGMAHATSAIILRWGVQGAVAAVWWGCGIASFFCKTQTESVAIFLVATFFGMVLFGLYAMMLERRRAAALVQNHA